MSRLHRTLLEVLVADIVGGALAVGQRLPTEKELAQRFGVSRGVAREGLRSLEERGLVTVKHGSGATVLPSSEWDMFNPDVIAAEISGDGGPRLLGDYLECRRLLEIEAAGLAAERATREQLVALSEALERMTAAAVQTTGAPSAEDRFHAADIAFHRAVIRATGNSALGGMTEPVHRARAAARRPLARRSCGSSAACPSIAASSRRSRTATPRGPRAAMRDHLLTVERYLSEYAADVTPEPRARPAERDRGVLRQPLDAGARDPRVRAGDGHAGRGRAAGPHAHGPRRLLNRMVHDGWLPATTAPVRPTRPRCGSSPSPPSSRSARRWSSTRTSRRRVHARTGEPSTR